MKKNNGFTLIELLAVIILLGIIMTIAIPNALKLGSNVKEQSYTTKIELIEKSAQSYGQSNVTSIKNSANKCRFNYASGDDTVESVEWNPAASRVNENTFPCETKTISELVQSNTLDYDETKACGTKCGNETDIEHYDNVVVNPKNNNIINECVVYIYYKYKRIYTYFDRETCDDVVTSGNFTNIRGHSYPPKR